MARSVRTRGVRFTRVRSAVGVLVLLALAVSVLGTGPASSAGSPKFSTNIEHYFPVSIAGQNVVIDPRIAGAPEGGCELPADGDAVTPLDKDSGVGNLQIADDIFGGVWQCPEGAQGNRLRGRARRDNRRKPTLRSGSRHQCLHRRRGPGDRAATGQGRQGCESDRIHLWRHDRAWKVQARDRRAPQACLGHGADAQRPEPGRSGRHAAQLLLAGHRTVEGG